LSRNLGTLTSWNPLGHSRPATGMLYLLLIVLLLGIIVMSVASANISVFLQSTPEM
jgi:hypothetical protein